MTVTAPARCRRPWGLPATLRVAVALAAIVTIVLVGMAGLFASPASARPLAGPGNAVGAFGAAGGQVVGAHQPVLAGQCRARAPSYDPVASGSCVAAETEPALANDVAQACSANSFTAATPVLLASGGEVPISKIHVGDKVLATDPQTGKTEARPVTNIIVHGGKHMMVDVTLDDGSQLTATDHHPFWDATTASFTYAIDLHVGDRVRKADGYLLTITAVHAFDENVNAYNLTVEGIHTHYAGTTPVLVHNSCADRVAAAVERNGGAEVDRGYSFATRSAARQAASEIAGDLGSNPSAIRASEFRGGPFWMRDSEQVIGRVSSGGTGWRDDFLGHVFGDGSSLGPHVNVWEPGSSGPHLFYPGG